MTVPRKSFWLISAASLLVFAAAPARAADAGGEARVCLEEVVLEVLEGAKTVRVKALAAPRLRFYGPGGKIIKEINLGLVRSNYSKSFLEGIFSYSSGAPAVTLDLAKKKFIPID